jgi:hypothetical protein
MSFPFRYRRSESDDEDIPILVEYFVNGFSEKMAKLIRNRAKRSGEEDDRSRSVRMGVREKSTPRAGHVERLN